MFTNFSEEAKSFIKNPLGIIGLLLAFVEAIAAIVIIKSTLCYSLNLILVLFIVLFPCMVLVVFYLLVSRYPENLYSPADYKGVDNFLKSYNPANQKEELTKKRKQKVNSIQSREGMSEEDINVIKENLNSIFETQKKLAIQKNEVLLVEEEQKKTDERWDTYEKEKLKKYRVEITPMEKSYNLISELKSRGYNANLYSSPGDIKKNENYQEYEAIWLGSEVPVKMAIEVIKVAKSIFPHLKYIELNDSSGAPDYVKYEVYIGGATSTAIERGLKELTYQDFEKLYTLENKSELHKYVRGFGFDNI